MNLNLIGNAIDAKTITASMGRILEIAFYGAVIAVLTYFEQCLQLNSFEGWRIPLTMFLTSLVAGILSGYAKQVRDLQEEKQNMLDNLNIPTPEEPTLI